MGICRCDTPPFLPLPNVNAAVSNVRFLFDGERVNNDDTPDSLEMEDGDALDVMVQQVRSFSGDVVSLKMRDQVTSPPTSFVVPPLPFPRFSCTLGWWLPVLNLKWSWWETFLSPPHESCAHPRRPTPPGSAIILRGGRNVFGLTLATPQLTWRRDGLLAARPCASGRRGERERLAAWLVWGASAWQLLPQ